MRPWLYSLVFVLLPVGAWAGATVTEEQVVFQKGKYAYEACLKVSAEEDRGDCLCEAEISYPQYHGLPSGEAGFNKAIRAAAIKIAGKTKSKEAGCHGALAQKFPEGRYGLPTHYRIKGKALFESDSILTVQLESDYYGSGAAHGLNSESYIVFDKKNGKVLRVGDVLDSKQKQAFNAYLFDKISATEGTNPDAGCDDAKGCDYTKKTNFTYYVNDKGVYAHFGLYGIAAYAAGTFDFPIPARFIAHSEIKKLAKE